MFDPEKSAANAAKHGIDSEAAQTLWSDLFMIEALALTETPTVRTPKSTSASPS